MAHGPGEHQRRDEQVYSITSASSSHSDELGAREITYAISMLVRTLCFVGGVVLWPYSMWVGLVLFLFAIFLPYTSVILANAGVRRQATGDDIMKPGPVGEIEGSRDDGPEQRG